LTLYLPEWAQDWLEIIVPGQIALILVAAWLLQNLLGRLLTRAGRHYQIPLELQMPIHGLMRWTICRHPAAGAGALGVSATVLWTGFTGFATVGAVAFFAAWSVLSNLFCAFLIFTVGPFRLGDTIELLDTAEKPGAKGVVDINLLYTTLEDATRGRPASCCRYPMR
jgi:small-conductance mechanosensitive channel